MRRSFVSCVRSSINSLETMYERHLAKGSPLPGVKPDVLRIYSMHFCPYAERTRLVLAHKKIPHELVNVNLKNKPDWLFERNPLGLVPIIEYKGHVIYESAICNEFLEGAFPATVGALLPSCVFKLAEARRLMHLSETKTILSLTRAKSSEDFFKKLNDYRNRQQEFERYLSSCGQTFFGGTQVGMVDLHLWPFYERVPVISDLLGVDILQEASFPRLHAWMAAMETVDAVKQCRISNELHKRFIVSYQSGNPQYDFDLKPGAASELLSNL